MELVRHTGRYVDDTAPGDRGGLLPDGDRPTAADDEIHLVLFVRLLGICGASVEGVEADGHMALPQKLKVGAVVGGPLSLQLLKPELLHLAAHPLPLVCSARRLLCICRVSAAYTAGTPGDLRVRLCHDHTMTNFLIKTLANATALAVAAWLVSGIAVTGSGLGERSLTLIVVALVFGVVNFVVKPLVSLFSLPLLVLTLGLFTLVINALMLMLTSWVSDQAELGFHVDGFGAAFLGGLIVSIVAWALHMVLPDRD
jgi:putative membrane protein